MNKICFFSEMGYVGLTPRDWDQLRVPSSWMAALKSDHYPIAKLHEIQDDTYDVGVLIIPKNLDHLLEYPIVDLMKKKCKRVGFQQEGTSWYYQDYPVDIQMWFWNIMTSMDFALAHSDSDVKYYESLLGIPSFENPSLIVDDILNFEPLPKEDKVIIGGNFVRYYGGFDSYITALRFEVPIWAPSMGRKLDGEEKLDGLNHLPYMTWLEWMRSLSSFKYAVHLNPNTIAGTFNLNCAYWGIPCIGNEKANTQRLCFPDLSVDPQDIGSAINMAIKLKDKVFYDEMSIKAKENYTKYFDENVYVKHMNKIFGEIING